jgi:hypothetical protein
MFSKESTKATIADRRQYELLIVSNSKRPGGNRGALMDTVDKLYGRSVVGMPEKVK